MKKVGVKHSEANMEAALGNKDSASSSFVLHILSRGFILKNDTWLNTPPGAPAQQLHSRQEKREEEERQKRSCLLAESTSQKSFPVS